VAPSGLARGTLIGRFVILEPLGAGATGVVYSAFDPTLDRQVALKVLYPTSGGPESTGTARARVEREARAMARVKHPSVVTIFDVGVAGDGSVFLAMEKIDGGTLGTWLQTRPSVREILRVFGEAGEGLAAAHASGLVHRDFKLENVLMDAHGHPRVTDFGLARALGAGAPVEDLSPRGESAGSLLVSLPSTLSRSGVALGTPGYMPPEQYGGHEPVDERSDVFAFCAALYRALYGERPFAGATIAEIESSTLRGAVTDAPRDTPVPSWLRRVLLKGLATKKSDRPSSMTELLAMLRDDPARRRRRGAAALLGVALVVGGAWGAHAKGELRAHLCDAASAPVRGVWDASRKETIAAAFKKTGTGYGDAAWAEVERVLDDYASRASLAREAACVATRVRGEQSSSMLELRTACLDDRLAELRALTDVLAAADADVVKTAAKAAHALSPLEPCANVDRLSAAVRLPDDPAARAEIRALQDEIAKSKELHEAGKKTGALALLESIRARVERAAWGPLSIAWNERIAVVEKWTDEKASIAHYEQAIALAERFHSDEHKAAAEVMLGSFEGSWLGHTEEGHMWMRMADASIARLGGDARLELARDEEEGWVYQYEHKLAQAAPLFRRVIERAPAIEGVDPDTIASAHSGLAEALSAEGKWDEGEDEARLALKTMADEYGPAHPWLAPYLNNLAVQQLAAGHVTEALASATHARDSLLADVARGDLEPNASDLGLAFHTLGEVQTRGRDYEGAAASLARARAIYVASHGQESADVAYADYERATALRALGRSGEAAAALDEATAIEAKVSDVPSAVQAGTLAAKGALALDRGDAVGAIALLTRALALVKDGETTAWELAAMRLTLAKALRARHADAARATTLAADARDVLQRSHDEPMAAEADAVARAQ
jgi:hypothetical protein